MARRQIDQLHASAGEEAIAANEKRVRLLACKTRERRAYLAAGAGLEFLDLQSHGTGNGFCVSKGDLRIDRVGRIDEHGDASQSRQELAQERHSLCHQLGIQKTDAGNLANRPIEACDKAIPDRVAPSREYDWYVRRCRLGGAHRRRSSGRRDHRDLPASQFNCHRRKAVKLTIGPAVFDRQVLALDVAGIHQALAKSSQAARMPIRRVGVDEPDHRQPCLLRPRADRPRRRRAAEERDEVATFHHSITSSAVPRSVGGTVTPTALAVFKLITRSSFVGRSIGRSWGFAPCKIFSTYSATRRIWKTRFGP